MFDYAKATFKRWQVKTMGQRPTDEMLTTAAHFAKGKPGKFALCLAMALRPEGVTAAEMVNAVGDPKHNVRRELIRQKLITYVDGEGNVLGPDGHYTNGNGHRVYHVALTAKGTAFIAKVIERAAKATAKAEAVQATPVAGKVKKPTNGHGKGSQVQALQVVAGHDQAAQG